MKSVKSFLKKNWVCAIVLLLSVFLTVGSLTRWYGLAPEKYSEKTVRSFAAKQVELALAAKEAETVAPETETAKPAEEAETVAPETETAKPAVTKQPEAKVVKGEKGDTGSQGPKGDTGSQGPKGDTGSQGPKGDTGKDGKNAPPPPKQDPPPPPKQDPPPATPPTPPPATPPTPPPSTPPEEKPATPPAVDLYEPLQHELDWFGWNSEQHGTFVAHALPKGSDVNKPAFNDFDGDILDILVQPNHCLVGNIQYFQEDNNFVSSRQIGKNVFFIRNTGDKAIRVRIKGVDGAWWLFDMSKVSFNQAIASQRETITTWQNRPPELKIAFAEIYPYKP